MMSFKFLLLLRMHAVYKLQLSFFLSFFSDFFGINLFSDFEMLKPLVAVCNCTCNLDSGLTGTSLTLPAEQSSICQLAQEDLIDSG
jgi:hypothetical protein